MPRYAAKVEVSGIVYIEVEAPDEVTAARQAAKLAELGDGTPNIAYDVVHIVEAGYR